MCLQKQELRGLQISNTSIRMKILILKGNSIRMKIRMKNLDSNTNTQDYCTPSKQ